MAIFMVTLITSCSWWPFGGARDSGNCLDDDSCEGANPFEEQLVGGTWYCYGVSRDEPWDCSQEQDSNKIVAVSDEPPPASEPETYEQASFGEDTTMAETVGLNRAEINNLREEISSQASAPANNFLDGFGDDAWAVQLIALQSRDEVESFVAMHGIADPKYVQIESGGAIWFVLILDVFADRASADSAAQVWETENEPSSRPWVRPVSSLKAAARRADS